MTIKRDTTSMVTFRAPAKMIAQIERLMNTRLDRPGRSALIRELLAEALEKAK